MAETACELRKEAEAKGARGPIFRLYGDDGGGDMRPRPWVLVGMECKPVLTGEVNGWATFREGDELVWRFARAEVKG